MKIIQLEELIEERKCRYFDRTFSEDKENSIETFRQWLISQRYSIKTVKSYIHGIRTFLGYFRNKRTDEIANEDVVNFSYKYVIGNNLSASLQNQIISAIKLYYCTTLKKDICIDEINRPNRPKRLPDIFSQSEVEKLLKSIINTKHRVMLALIYACGLRRSELINLRINAIDSKRRLLIIRGGKGNKDRVVPLPKAMIDMLRAYYMMYKPKYWLFEGHEEGRQYSESSIQHVFEQAVRKSGIKKDITLHSLRHSYATHLLENGVDLRFIQELLGHRSSKTTEIYTHVTEKSIEKIKSPFENLNL